MSKSGDITVSLRGSAASTWMRCSVKAKWEEDHQYQTVSAAAKAGEGIHEGVTGHVPTNMGKRVKFDKKTRTPKELERQVEATKIRVNKWLLQKGWETLEREQELNAIFKMRVDDDITAMVKTTGHIDLVLRHKDRDDIVVVDLKTGLHAPVTSWPQIAVYALLWSETYGNEAWAGMLWAPRDGSRQPELLLRKDLRKEGLQVIKWRAACAVSGEVARPGLDCHTCQVLGCGLRQSWEVC